MSRWDLPAPFLRAVGECVSLWPLPEGWETQPAGTIDGHVIEVAFDPLRHDVMLLWNGGLDPVVARAITEAGWRPTASTDSVQIWSRDRLVIALREAITAAPDRRRGRRRGRAA